MLDLGPSDSIGEGRAAQYTAGDVRVLVCRVAGRLHAVDAICPHRGAFLVQGNLSGSVIECPWHQWQFDVTTGEGLTNPMSCLHRYEVAEEGGRILLTLPAQ